MWGLTIADRQRHKLPVQKPRGAENNELLVVAYDNETGAGDAITRVLELQKQQYIALADAATVIRKPDGKIKVKQANNLVGAGALGGAFWGMLFGLLFAIPWLGLAIGAISGTIGGKMADVGIDDKFIKEVRRDDLIGALGRVLVAVISVLPSLAPFVVLSGDFMLALRVSNLVSFAMLFAAGWGYGHYSRMNPWKTGLTLVPAGGVLGVTAILLQK